MKKVAIISGPDDIYWIGLNDIDIEGDFRWKNGSKTNFTYWRDGQPNGQTKENCVGLALTDGKWVDIPCESQLQGFICRRKNPCYHYCKNNGECREVDYKPVCTCQPGYTGIQCLNDNNLVCLNIDHQCEQLCVGDGDGDKYHCECNKGFTLNSNSKTCTDVNECSTDNGGCGGAKCINSLGTYYCECERGYVVNPNGGKCIDKFDITRYSYHAIYTSNFLAIYSHDEAQKKCQDIESDLTTISYFDEQEHVVKIMKQAVGIFHTTHNNLYWIGLNDVHIEGDFRWKDESKTNFTYWRVGEPNGLRRENCVGLPLTDGKWIDIPCGSLLHGFICRRNSKLDLTRYIYHAIFDLFSTLYSHDEAQKKCQEKKSDLTTISNIDEQEHVAEIMKQAVGGWNRPDDVYWIGLNDVHVEGDFRWKDGSKITFTYWRDGEPNGQKGENCVGLSITDGKWVDIPCDSKPKGFICRRKAPCYNYCKNNGECCEVDYKAVCTCKYGYTGIQCLNDVNECTTVNVCGAGNCTNLLGTYHCECEVGYNINPNDGKCIGKFDLTRYIYYTKYGTFDKYSHDAAQKKCHERKSNLTTISHIDEQKYVVSIMKKAVSISSHQGKYAFYWIGLNDVDIELLELELNEVFKVA